MADQTNKSHRAPPVSYSGNQQELEHLTAADAIQRGADAMIAETQLYSRLYFGNDDLPSDIAARANQPARPRSARQSVDPLSGFGEQDIKTGSPRGRRVVSSESEGEYFSPERRSNRSPFPSLSGRMPKQPAAITQSPTPGNDNRRRLSARSSPSAAEPVLRFGETWHTASDSTLDFTGKSRSPRRTPSSRNLRHNVKQSSGCRSSTKARDMSRDYRRTNESTSSLPASVGRGKPAGNVHENAITAASKARAFGAPNAAPLRPQSYQTLVPERDSTPTSIQIGGYTYVRQDDDEPDMTADLQDELDEKSCKGQPGGPPLTLLHETAFVFIICMAQALMLAGVSQALIPAGIIGESFGLSRPADLAWFSAAYALTSGTFVLPAGRLGDLFGHKNVFIIGFFWFATWSFITGFALQVHDSGANGMIYFNVCRALQGIGPALQIPNGQAMLGRAYRPGPRKALVMSLFGAAAPFGFVAGGAMSSLFTQLLNFPWSFWALAAVCVAFGSISILVLPNWPLKKRHRAESLWAQLDGFGIILGVTGLVLFNIAWNQAAQVSWSTPYTYFLLIISVLFLSAFAYVELHAKYPILPLSAMRFQTNFVLGCTAAGWGCFAVWVFYSFQFLELLRGWTPLLAAASHGPGPFTGLIASLLVARYMTRIGPHWIMLIAMVAFFTGSLLMATAPVNQVYWGNTLFSVLIMPFGMDMSNPASIILLSNSVSKEHQGIAASLVVTVVNYSISTALGIAATIETQVNSNGEEILAGFRGAQYFGVGLGFLGCIVALAFALMTLARQRAAARPVEEEKQANASSIMISDTEISV